MAASSSHMWYVRAAGGVWGPYPEARIAAFAAEGRVRADTPLSPWADGPFAPAQGNAEFQTLFAAEPAPLAPEARAPAAEPVLLAPAEPVRATPEPAPASGPVRAVLVWAQIETSRIADFHAALAAIGPGVTVRPGLWLVQARAGPAALRNHLSRRLGPADALLVVEAPLEQAAWFNIKGDRELRALWAHASPIGGTASSHRS